MQRFSWAAVPECCATKNLDPDLNGVAVDTAASLLASASIRCASRLLLCRKRLLLSPSLECAVTVGSHLAYSFTHPPSPSTSPSRLPLFVGIPITVRPGSRQLDWIFAWHYNHLRSHWIGLVLRWPNCFGRSLGSRSALWFAAIAITSDSLHREGTIDGSSLPCLAETSGSFKR